MRTIAPSSGPHSIEHTQIVIVVHLAKSPAWDGDLFPTLPLVPSTTPGMQWTLKGIS